MKGRMMDSKEFIACIGKPEDAPEVQRVLAGIGFTKKLKMPKDDIDARVTMPQMGLSLVFKPEGPKSSRLVLNAAQFISDTEKGNMSFPGALPAKLVFSDGQVEARVKLGKPFDTKPALRRDIWKLENLNLAIKYSKDAPHKIAVVTVEIPLKI
jgi:hypothetical protein